MAVSVNVDPSLWGGSLQTEPLVGVDVRVSDVWKLPYTIIVAITYEEAVRPFRYLILEDF